MGEYLKALIIFPDIDFTSFFFIRFPNVDNSFQKNQTKKKMKWNESKHLITATEFCYNLKGKENVKRRKEKWHK